jgi:serine/threonine protein kinase
MSVEPSVSRCPRCGAPVPDSAAEGLCTRCLLEAATAPTEAGQASGHRPTAPPLERIAAAFPQLEIVELIGTGGMGAVFKARQPKLDRYVALKVLPEALARDPAFAERFQREGRVLARLNHPNIVTVHDFGQAGGFFYLLMEYVDGVNLRQAMRAGRFTPAQALALVPRICEALQFAHDAGVLHRDIKPENILLDARGRVKIADFGIAKLMGETRADVSLTATGAAVGTPQYMAPEQIESPAGVDHRADIYSLGVVFYELLTGELPLGRFAPPSAKIDLDARIDEIVLRALTKERELRQQSAREVKTEVEGVTARGGATPSTGAEVAELGHVAPLWQVSLRSRQAIRAVLIAFLGCLGYTTAVQWLPWQHLMGSFLTQSWTVALATGAAILTVLGLGSLAWRRRAVWWSALHLPGPASADVTDRWLRALVLGLVACVAVNLAQMALTTVGLAGQALASGEFGRAAFALAFPGLILGLLGWLVRREQRRTDLSSPAPLPAWAHRVAVGLLFAALVSAVSVVLAIGGEYMTLVGCGEFLALASVALWTGSRLWRAVALALNSASLLLAIPICNVVFVAWALKDEPAVLQAAAGQPTTDMLASYPFATAVLRLLAWLGVAGALATLLNPSVRAAFGLPARRRPRAGAGAPPLAPAV